MKGQVSNFDQVASVRRSVITDGVSQGLKIIDCDNGKIRFILNESKALDVMQLYHEGQNVSYVSKNGFSTKDCAFSKRFEGGMLYTCGFESVGDRDGFELHGTLHNNVANVLRAECNENGITIEACIKSTELFGCNLKLIRKVYSAIGSESLTITDTLINEEFGDQDYAVLYHVNVGYPLLDEGAKLIDNPVNVIPRTAISKKRLSDRNVMGAPVPLDDETCYFIEQAKPEVSIVNEKIGKKFTLKYSNDTLDKFIQWKTLRSSDYAMGLEPATTVLDDGFKYKTIKSGESVNFKLELSVSKI